MFIAIYCYVTVGCGPATGTASICLAPSWGTLPVYVVGYLPVCFWTVGSVEEKVPSQTLKQLFLQLKLVFFKKGVSNKW